MAHAATLDRLAEGLVKSLTGQSAENRAVRALKGQALKGIRDQSHARTNQFAIKDKLEGLAEKFSVLNRDDLSDALRSRLDELPTRSKWTPEALALLLELSDRPAEKTCAESLQETIRSEDLGPRLTWEELLADDPLEQPDIWEDVDRGYHSSGNEFDSELEHGDDSDRTTSTDLTSISQDDPASVARLYLTQPSAVALTDVKRSREAWTRARRSKTGTIISELSIIRETLAMLHGVPTDLFDTNSSSGRVTLLTKAALATASVGSRLDALQMCARTGSALNFLRSWTKTPQPLVHTRSVQRSVQRLLSSFASDLGRIEQQLLTPSVDTPVSMIDIQADIQLLATPLVHISSIVQISSFSTGESGQLTLLDTLYEEACVTQMAGNQKAYEALIEVFLAGLSTYLRPATFWAKTGAKDPRSQEAAFIKDADEYCEPGNIWRNRFHLIRRSDGMPFVPKCMQSIGDRLFALGKSRFFLRRLDQEADYEGLTNTGLECAVPDFGTVLSQLQKNGLASFAEVLNTRLECWLNDVGTDCTPLLRSALWNQHGLSQLMAAVPFIYFSKDGTMFGAFAETLIDRITSGNGSTTWQDQFLLTELAHSTLGTAHEVEAECLSISIPESEQSASVSTSTLHKLSTVNLEYVFSWPIQNVTGCRTSDTFAKAFAFQLQLHHACRILCNSFFDLRSHHLRSSPMLPLRQKLLNFIGIIHTHVTTTAHDIHKAMWKAMQSASDIDAMVHVWAEYERRLQTSLLLSLNLEPVRAAVTAILELSEALTVSSNATAIGPLQTRFSENVTFFIAGIRGVSRAGGEPALETLAERLEWSVG